MRPRKILTSSVFKLSIWVTSIEFRTSEEAQNSLRFSDPKYRCLPYLVFRHSAHITCLCEASDEHGGIALHQQVARDHGMIGMVVHLCIQRSIPSRLLFLSEEIIQLELLLNCLAITNVKLRIRKRQKQILVNSWSDFSPLPWQEHIRRIR